jgi:hypothetical protein
VPLYLHGAGWVFGSPASHDRLVRELMAGTGAGSSSPTTSAPWRRDDEAEADAEQAQARTAFHRMRTAGSAQVAVRTIERGELPAGTDPEAVIEQLVAPAYLRLLLTEV